ncbi:hypothetical protein LuPra_03816 [Luteitalea pratensis]|uniref:Uncharacterized protein n=1 Tax=Luteitalea pratensis TaxID=1855912 RepID=A0A143PRX5_LUTPR|nr:hypothetical protein [Luteitalea pratensis]AMY10579.1 hypothetical protein LuPra_03816 [Luteitalea pratensis]
MPTHAVMEPYSGSVPRPDVSVSVARWGDEETWGGSSWSAVHVPTQIVAYVSFERGSSPMTSR